MSSAGELIKYEDTVLHLAWKVAGGGSTAFGQVVTNAERLGKEKYVALANPWLTKSADAIQAKAGSAYELGVLQHLFTKVLGRRDGLIQLGYGSATPTGEEKVVAAGEKLLGRFTPDFEKYAKYAVALLVLWLLISLSRR